MTSPASFFGRLATLGERAEAARALAIALGAEDLLLFVRDAELGTLLPAPGFTQTIPRGNAWRAFLDRGLAEGECEGVMPAPSGEDDVALAVRVDDDAVLVLRGGTPDRARLQELLPLVPLLVALVQTEESVRAGAVQSQLARAERDKSVILTRALENSRDQLRDALQAARDARDLTEEQAAELEMVAAELTESREELRITNDELLHLNAELQRTVEDANRARAYAEEANLAKSTFLAMMSHELRTPLNAIGGYAALLEEGIMGQLTDGQRQYLARIKRSQAHLLSLINDVLNFAKVESGTIVYNIVPLPLVQVLEGTAPLIEPMAAARDVRYEYCPPAAPILVAADRDKVVQIVLNLLTNAVKFTLAGGNVRMEAAVVDGAARIAVRDTGAGIPRSRLASIFEPFVQLERSFGHEREGVGLGLSISRELARGMGGDLTVESEMGRGSTFVLSLPIASTTE